MTDNLEKLYEKYNTLSEAKDKISEHSKEYAESIDGVRGSESEKMLAAQILSKFFKHFPALQDRALNAMLDLCEDEETKIRACAMRYLVSIVKDVKEYLPKVTDILAQMMQLDVQRDQSTASWCLMQLYKEDSINVIKTLFNHLQILKNAPARVKCLKFMVSKIIKPLDKQTPEIENIIVEESKKLLQEDIDPEEIVTLINLLKSSKYGKTLAGQQEMLDFLSEIIELDRDVDATEPGVIDKIIICVSHALPFFSSKIESTKFVAYYCDQVLPQWDKINSIKDGDLLQLQILRHLAELSINCGKFENPSLHVVQIFDKLKLYMPPPPENADVYKMPNLEFSFVECLLYAFHRLARQCPDFLTHDPEILKDFRARLMYFSRGVQGCNKAVNNITTTTGFDTVSVSKIKVAPAVLNNINVIIKDLFYQPPMYKCNVTLSFKQENLQTEQVKKTPNSGSLKRHTPITFDNGSGPKQSRAARSGENIKLYTPPSGKFSNNFQNYERGRGRGRGRGMRGRGSGRNWRN